MTLSDRDLLDGCFALIKASVQVPTKGMTIRYVCDALDTKIDQKASGEGTRFTVRGKGWAFAVVVAMGNVYLITKRGSDADIDQTFTLARIAA